MTDAEKPPECPVCGGVLEPGPRGRPRKYHAGLCTRTAKGDRRAALRLADELERNADEWEAMFPGELGRRHASGLRREAASIREGGTHG